MAKVHQVRLVSGTTVVTCFVDKPAECGDVVELKDEPGRMWEVVYSDSIVIDSRTINRHWNNNI